MIQLFFAFIISILITQLSLYKLHSPHAHELKNLAVPPKGIEHFTLGFSNAVADMFWIRLIQDMDYCQGINQTEAKIKDESERPKCHEGWVYKMFDLITDLSPKFYLVYRVGITALPVIVRDVEGGDKFIQKAIKKYPNDWTIAYRSAYFYIYEKKDLTEAARLLRIAGENGAPPWVMSLSARLYDEAGQLLIGISTLEEYLKTAKKNEYTEYLEKKIKGLKAKYEKLKK